MRGHLYAGAWHSGIEWSPPLEVRRGFIVVGINEQEKLNAVTEDLQRGTTTCQTPLRKTSGFVAKIGDCHKDLVIIAHNHDPFLAEDCVQTARYQNLGHFLASLSKLSKGISDRIYQERHTVDSHIHEQLP